MMVKAGDTAYYTPRQGGGQETVMVHDVDHQNGLAQVEVLGVEKGTILEVDLETLETT